MIDDKCKTCTELVVPHFGIYARPQPKLPEELKVGTCRCNMDPYNRKAEGYCGWCHPELCKGPGHPYYFDWNSKNLDSVFIN